MDIRDTTPPSEKIFEQRGTLSASRGEGSQLHPCVTHCDPNLGEHVITEQRRVPSASVLLLLLLLPCCAFAIRRGAVEPESVTSCWARPSRQFVSSPSPPPARGCHGALMRRPAMQAVRGRHERSRPPRLLAVLPRGPWEQDARPQGPCNHGVHPGTGVHFATTSKWQPTHASIPRDHTSSIPDLPLPK